jgi:hypothetical protein
VPKRDSTSTASAIPLPMNGVGSRGHKQFLLAPFYSFHTFRLFQLAPDNRHQETPSEITSCRSCPMSSRRFGTRILYVCTSTRIAPARYHVFRRALPYIHVEKLKHALPHCSKLSLRQAVSSGFPDLRFRRPFPSRSPCSVCRILNRLSRRSVGPTHPIRAGVCTPKCTPESRSFKRPAHAHHQLYAMQQT